MSEIPSKNPPQAPSRTRKPSAGRRVHGPTKKPRPIDPAPADPSRPLAALARALEAARGGAPESPILLVRPCDLEGLSASDLRPGLDELIVASHADAGLDSLLTTGLLEALLPEVEAMVGFGDGEWRHK